MPDPTALPPAAPAAVTPTPTPAPAPSPALTPAAPPAEARHPGHSSLMARLFEENDAPSDGQPAKKKEDSPAAPTPPPAEPAPATPAPPKSEEPPLKVRKPKRPDLPIATPPVAPPTPAPVAATPPADAAAFEEGLTDAEKTMLENARAAEKANAAKHKGLEAKTVAFLKKHADFLEKNPDIDENDPVYKTFLKTHRPTLSAGDLREIDEKRIADRAIAQTAPQIEKLEHELFVRDETPKIEKVATQTNAELWNTAMPAEVYSAIKEKGLDVAKEEFAEEIEVSGAIINTATEDFKEFKRLTTKSARGVPLSQFDEKNPQHTRIVSMVNTVGEQFKEAGQGLQKDGKWFVTRQEMQALPPAERPKYWTFTNDEIIQRARAWIPTSIVSALKTRRENWEKMGYVRKPRAAAPAPAPVPPAPVGAPAMRPSPSPAAAPAPAGAVDASTKAFAGRLLSSE